MQPDHFDDNTDELSAANIAPARDSDPEGNRPTRSAGEPARWVQLAYDLEQRAADDAAERGEVY